LGIFVAQSGCIRAGETKLAELECFRFIRGERAILTIGRMEREVLFDNHGCGAGRRRVVREFPAVTCRWGAVIGAVTLTRQPGVSGVAVVEAALISDSSPGASDGRNRGTNDSLLNAGAAQLANVSGGWLFMACCAGLTPLVAKSA